MKEPRALHPTVLGSLALLCVVFVSYLPRREKDMLHTHGYFHYLGHGAVFAGLAFLVTGRLRSVQARVTWLFTLVLFAATLETGQYLLYSGIHLEWADIAADAIGAAAGVLLASAWLSYRSAPAFSRP